MLPTFSGPDYGEQSDTTEMEFKEFKKDGIWSHYLRDRTGSSAQCITCRKILKCSGGSTKGLHVHQQTVHGSENVKQKVIPVLDSLVNPPKKRKIIDYFHSGENSLPAVLARMTAIDGLPFALFITSSDLRQCLRSMGHELPKCAKSIRVQVCKYADTIKSRLINEIKVAKSAGRRFSLTFDEWTSTKKRRYLNINLHGNVGNRNWHNLGLIRILGSFPAERCVQALSSKLGQFGLDINKDIVNVTTDGCAMMVKVGKLIAPGQQLCLAHGLQLAVLDVLYNRQDMLSQSEMNDYLGDSCGETETSDSEEEVNGLVIETGNQWDESSVGKVKDGKLRDVIQKSRRIVKLFKRSPLKNEILHNHMKSSKLGEVSLILDTKTRWSSLANMLDRLVHTKPAVQKALIDLNSTETMTDEDFNTIGEIAQALQPLRAAVEALCRRDSNLLTADAVVKFAIADLKKQSSDLSRELSDAISQRLVEQRTTEASAVLCYLHNPQAGTLKKSIVKTYCLKLLARLELVSFNEREATDNHDLSQTEWEITPLASTSTNTQGSVETRLQEAIATSMKVNINLTKAMDFSSVIANELVSAEQSGQRGHCLENA